MRSFLLAAVVAILFAGCGSYDPYHYKSRTFTFASWNVGHYALGKDWKTAIGQADAAKKSADYRAFLDEVGADILGVAEYSECFTKDGTTKADDAVFSRYRQRVIGPQHEWQWNAQFWNGCFGSTRTVKYPKHFQNVYYIATRLKIAGEEIVFVSTHLDWHYDANKRKSQMRKLVDDFKDDPRVVIAGDFNVGIREPGKKALDNPAEYRVFADAGFTLGNDGRYKTAPAGKTNDPENCYALDNIIVKGLEILEFRVFDRPDLSDHALVRAKLKLKP